MPSCARYWCTIPPSGPTASRWQGRARRVRDTPRCGFPNSMWQPMREPTATLTAPTAIPAMAREPPASCWAPAAPSVLEPKPAVSKPRRRSRLATTTPSASGSPSTSTSSRALEKATTRFIRSLRPRPTKRFSSTPVAARCFRCCRRPVPPGGASAPSKPCWPPTSKIRCAPTGSSSTPGRS